MTALAAALAAWKPSRRWLPPAAYGHLRDDDLAATVLLVLHLRVEMTRLWDAEVQRLIIGHGRGRRLRGILNAPGVTA